MTASVGMYVATLAHPGGLASSLVDDAAARLGAAPAWLDEGRAVDLPTGRPDAAALLADVEAAADVFVQPAGQRTRRLFVADMDSTMIGCECIDELADYAGVKAEVAAVTERAMRGELEFGRSLRARVALLEGLPEAAVAACLAERVRPNPGAATLLATLRAHGVRAVLVTGGFTAFAGPVAASLGFDRVVANRLGVNGGVLTGEVEGAIVDAEAKAAVLAEEAAPLGGPGVALAVGDGANDVPMVRLAGLGVAYRAKPALAAAADARIAHGDLTTILWALGIPSARWVEPA